MAVFDIIPFQVPYIMGVFFFEQEYHPPNVTDIYSQIIFDRTAETVTQLEAQRGKPAFKPNWILKITWENVLPVSYQKINLSEV